MNTEQNSPLVAEVDSRVDAIDSLRKAIARHLVYTVGKDEFAEIGRAHV